MKVKRLAAAAVAVALAAAVAASGTAHAAPVHGYPNATAYHEAVKLSHLKTRTRMPPSGSPRRTVPGTSRPRSTSRRSTAWASPPLSAAP
jgi:hypothetical protein